MGQVGFSFGLPNNDHFSAYSLILNALIEWKVLPLPETLVFEVIFDETTLLGTIQ